MQNLVKHKLVIIVLTYNEEANLQRFVTALEGLSIPVVVVDSGSTDDTIAIAKQAGFTILYHPFINHPLQWEYALTHCPILAEWIIGLDADQIPSPALIQKLQYFTNATIPTSVNGIYFNRHNFFQGCRLRFGGYRNFYMLKMFRRGKGYSDIQAKLDHRFIVEGETVVWKDGILYEDNIKEYDLDFWLQKHVHYSNQVADEELTRRRNPKAPSVQPKLFGSPDERKAFFKEIWWELPLFVRPHIYFFYRFIIRLGILEKREGRVFHYLQSYWFRMLIDYKIYVSIAKKKAD